MSRTLTADPRSAPRARGLVTSLLVATIAMLAMATPALAKMPPFTIELETANPVQGEPITLTVRMFEDAQHTIPADWFEGAPGGMLAVIPTDGVSGAARSVPVRLNKIGPGIYSGRAVIDRPGRWILRAFPDRSGWGTSELPPGYPSDIVLEVRASAPDLGFVPLMVGAILSAAGGLLVVWRRSMVAGRRSALDPHTGEAG